MVAAFKHLWSDSWGPRLEHFLFHGIAALISRQHATLLDLPRLYTDDAFRERIIAKVTDPETRRFWHEEYPSYTKTQRAEAAAPILNKAGQFSASPHLRLILGQVAPRLDLAFTMNNRRILIANLAKGTIGEQAANLLGSLLVSHMQLVAMERGGLPPEQRVPFFVHVDEFQSFSSEAFASLLSEARKFATHFCLANQYTDQLSPAVRAAVLGNAGTLVVFRVGSRDAELLAPEFRPMDAGGLADQEPFSSPAAPRRWPGPHPCRGQAIRATWHGRDSRRTEPAAVRPGTRHDRARATNERLEQSPRARNSGNLIIGTALCVLVAPLITSRLFGADSDLRKDPAAVLENIMTIMSTSTKCWFLLIKNILHPSRLFRKSLDFIENSFPCG